jgi:hypothetical protein
MNRRTAILTAAAAVVGSQLPGVTAPIDTSNRSYKISDILEVLKRNKAVSMTTVCEQLVMEGKARLIDPSDIQLFGPTLYGRQG